MKKLLIALAALAVLALALLIPRLLTGEDSWICDDGRWVKHGAPSAPMPAKPCGQARAEADFVETGRFVQNNPGLESGVWYLIYEKPGAPALTAKLIFDADSSCVFNGNEGKCPDIVLISSALTTVTGVREGDAVRVRTAISGGWGR